MNNNKKILEYSIKNQEIFMDKYYMFVEKHNDLDLYVDKTKKIKNILITIKELTVKKYSQETIEKLYIDLHKEIKKYANYSEFGCFINACDSNIDEVKRDIDLLKEITKLYIKYRDITEIVPSEWMQALLDKGASRRKGQVGEGKLIDILIEGGFTFTKSVDEFKKNKLSVAKSTGEFLNKGLKDNFSINIGKKKQNKKIDLIIKVNKDIYFLEAKHMNTGGGGQDKQNVEYIDLIKEKAPKDNYHIVSFLDGLYFNKLFSSHKNNNKMSNQEKDIRLALIKNKNNYFLNTAGFKKLFLNK